MDVEWILVEVTFDPIWVEELGEGYIVGLEISVE